MSADLAAEEARLERLAPGYLERVRRAASELAVADPDADDARAALDAVDHFGQIDLDVPTASRLPGVALLKTMIKRLIGWYLGFLGRQLKTFAQAVTNLADILVERNEELTRVSSELQVEVERLSERVDRLERAGPG
jgi:hypothetical protein